MTFLKHSDLAVSWHSGQDAGSRKRAWHGAVEETSQKQREERTHTELLTGKRERERARSPNQLNNGVLGVIGAWKTERLGIPTQPSPTMARPAPEQEDRRLIY